MSNQIRRNKKLLIDALKRTAGNVSQACEQANLSRETFYKYYRNDCKFRQEVDNIKESLIDFAETALLKNIKEGDNTAIIFYLKTQGRHRGYIERQEVEHSGNISITQLLTELGNESES